MGCKGQNQNLQVPGPASGPGSGPGFNQFPGNLVLVKTGSGPVKVLVLVPVPVLDPVPVLFLVPDADPVLKIVKK